MLAQESNQRSALKCKRTFDRASEPGPPTPPLEVRLEMRSVCAVALCTTAAPRYGSASRTPQQSDVHASRRRTASAAGLLVSATTAAPVARSLGTQGTAHVDRICSTSPGIKSQAALALRRREACTSDCWTVRLALPYLGAAVVLSATAHTDRISSLNSSGAVAANGSHARSNVRLHLKALLWLLSYASKKVTRRRAAPGALSHSEQTPARRWTASPEIIRSFPFHPSRKTRSAMEH